MRQNMVGPGLFMMTQRMMEASYLVLIVSSGLSLLLATMWLVFKCVFLYLLSVDSD